jgi:radical SAM protein with 4Fe4S-binding SPASM domain
VFLHDLAAGDLLAQPIEAILAMPQFGALRARRRDLPASCRGAGCGHEEVCRGGCAARAYLTGGSLHARDPYCPQGEERLPISLVVAPARVRVHERYLCTVVTRPKESVKCASSSTASISPASPRSRRALPVL